MLHEQRGMVAVHSAVLLAPYAIDTSRSSRQRTMSRDPSIAADVRAWAYSDDPEPQQDFDLMITGLGHEPSFLEWAADDGCPKKGYFLSCLYLFVGDAVRTKYQSNSKADVDGLLNRAGNITDHDVREWLHRSRQLIADPESFEYDLWCGGGYAGGAR
jgi:hypothetical protein